MKKLLSVFIVCLLLLAFAGCEPDAPTQPMPQEDNKVHLIVLAGQSGARGKALVEDLSAEDREANADVDILADGLPMGELDNIPGVDESAYIDVLEPGYGDFPSEFGPELGMGQTMASRYPKFDADYRSVIVKYTASGSTFTDHWYSASAVSDSALAESLNLDQAAQTADGSRTGPLTANLYQLVEQAVAELEELGYEVVIDGMAFVHGEQDAKFEENMGIYEKALTYFINDFRAYFGNEAMPVVITEALTNSAQYSNELRAIQASVAQSVSNVTLVQTGDLQTNTFEPWHFGAGSNNILGNRIAAEIISHNDTRIIEAIDEEVLYVPQGVPVELPRYVKARFTNYYSGYVKVEQYGSYDCNQPGPQDVTFTVKTGEGLKEFTLPIYVSDSVAFVDGRLSEYASARKNLLPDGKGEVYVLRGEQGLYIAANIRDTQLWTDGENWKRGDMGQKGNNDDFIVFITDSAAAERKTLCLSAANLLRVYDSGISLDSSDVTLEYGNLVFTKKISGYRYHVTTAGQANGGPSERMTLELYISYEALGIDDPDAIRLCFRYNDVSGTADSRTNTNFDLVKTPGDRPEENTDSYFTLQELTGQ